MKPIIIQVQRRTVVTPSKNGIPIVQEVVGGIFCAVGMAVILVFGLAM